MNKPCSACRHLGTCPCPESCEQAEIQRQTRAAWRDFRVAAAFIAVLAVAVLILIN